MMYKNLTLVEYLINKQPNNAANSIVGVMTGSRGDHGCDIWQPEDFKECAELLKHFPEWKQRLPEMIAKDPTWAPFVEAWDDLTRLITELSVVEELPGGGQLIRPSSFNALFKQCMEEAQAIAKAAIEAREDHRP